MKEEARPSCEKDGGVDYHTKKSREGLKRAWEMEE